MPEDTGLDDISPLIQTSLQQQMKLQQRILPNPERCILISYIIALPAQPI